MDAAHLQQRAREHGMLVLMSNFGGHDGTEASAGRSAVWAPDGMLLACAAETGETLVMAERVGGAWTGRLS